jgi:hypothetical protein
MASLGNVTVEMLESGKLEILDVGNEMKCNGMHVIQIFKMH